MSLNYQKDLLSIKIEGSCEKKPGNFQELYDLLNAARRPELEGYYYELLGSSVGRGELKLLGTLIDRADMSFENNRLSIAVYRLMNGTAKKS